MGKNFNKVLIVVFLSVLIESATAQKIKLSIAAEGAMPIGGAADVISTGIGGRAGAELFPEESNISYEVSAGSLFFKGASDALFRTTSRYTMIPIEVGIKNHFDDEYQEKGFYFMGQLGYIAIASTIKWNETDSLGAVHPLHLSASKGGFLLAPAIGYQTLRFDFRLSYTFLTVTAPYYLFDSSSGTSEILSIHVAVFLNGNKNSGVIIVE